MFVICINSHYLALLLLPTACILWLFQKKSKKNILIAVAIFLISLTPQILFDLKHDGQNIKSIIAFFSAPESISSSSSLSIFKIITVFQQISTRLLAGKNIIFGSIISLIFGSLFFREWYLQFKNKRYHRPFLIMCLWFLSGIIGLIFINQNLNDHYFAFLFPVIFILFSSLIYQLPKYLTITIIILITIFSILENPFRWSAPRQLETTIAIEKSVIIASNQQPFNFALLAKTNYDPGYRYFLTKDKAPVYLLDQKITDQLFVVCEPSSTSCNPINNPEWDVAAFGWAKIDSQWEINGVKIYKLIHTQSNLF
jgi:hypothetical protein